MHPFFRRSIFRIGSFGNLDGDRPLPKWCALRIGAHPPIPRAENSVQMDRTCLEVQKEGASCRRLVRDAHRCGMRTVLELHASTSEGERSMWLLTLACDGCGTSLEMPPEDRQVDPSESAHTRADWTPSGRGEEITDEAIARGWAAPDRGPQLPWYCPTCRLARERRSLVPDSQPEHLSQSIPPIP